jgi:hypothetical protein
MMVVWLEEYLDLYGRSMSTSQNAWEAFLGDLDWDIKNGLLIEYSIQD